jgi:hypothetical protein
MLVFPPLFFLIGPYETWFFPLMGYHFFFLLLPLISLKISSRSNRQESPILNPGSCPVKANLYMVASESFRYRPNSLAVIKLVINEPPENLLANCGPGLFRGNRIRVELNWKPIFLSVFPEETLSIPDNSEGITPPYVHLGKNVPPKPKEVPGSSATEKALL